MANLTKQDLIEIHAQIQRRFKTTPGINDEGLVDSIVQRPDQIIHGRIIFPDIFLKAASLMEAIIRWHAFTDGNKRTGLLATESYLDINGYFCFFPLHAVRFSVNVARTQGDDQKKIDKLIEDIARWLRKYIAPKDDIKTINTIIHSFVQENKVVVEMSKERPEQSRMIFDYWLAVDIYPEYGKDIWEVIGFINDINSKALQDLKNMG